MAPTEGARMEGASMEVTSTKASLVANGGVEAESRLTVTLPRFEVETALAEDEAPELVLDVLRATGEEANPERHTISVGWDPADIKKLLQETPGDAITFAFERDELERLIESDTELHGMREKALVLSVAVIAAAGGASTAAAGYDELSPAQRGIATVAQHDELTNAQRGIETPVASSHDELTTQQRGIETPAPAVHDELTAAQRGIEAVTPAVHDELTAAQRGIEAVTPAVHDELTTAQRGIEAVTPAVHDELTLGQRGVPDNVVATPDEATLTQRGIETPAVSGRDTSAAVSDLPSLDPSTAAALGIAGGMGLLIVGAAFVARRRTPHPA
jgi:hypothetical protein